jgi:hypothetical protein
MLRKIDAKQIHQLLKLQRTSVLTSEDILRWAFAHTIAQVSEELQVATYQRLQAIIRQRAYNLLRGKCNLERLPNSLTEETKLQLWQDLHDKGILDGNDRVRHEIKLKQLQGLTGISPDVQEEFLRRLNNLYHYRQKQAGSETVALSLGAFSEQCNYMLEQILPLDTCEHMSDRLNHYKKVLITHFGGILLPEDHQKIDSFIQQAQQFLPRWSMGKQLQQQVEREHQQVVHFMLQNRQQQSVQENEKIKEQQQEKQTQHFTFFKPAVQIKWQYNELLVERFESLLVNMQQLTKPTRKLRLLRLKDVISLPFLPHIFISENFLHTELNTQSFQKFVKSIQYYLEIQEAKQRIYLITDRWEVGYIKACLEKRLLDAKAIGIYLLSGRLMAANTAFQERAPEGSLQVQLHFLSGTAENELPNYLQSAWLAWKAQCDQKCLSEMQQQLWIALALR